MIKLFADWLTFNVLGIAEQTHFGAAVGFFIYDTIKITLMLTVIIFLVSVIRSFFPPRECPENAREAK